MGDIILPRRLFLWCMALIYMVAFVSLYVQIPGLYGNDGLLPARWQLRYTGKPLLDQLLSSPTLLWLGPYLGLDTQTAMELLCLTGAALSLAATLVEALRDSLVFFCLWALYLSMYQVGQVFLYFQWDNLLLETGFLCVLVAPLTSIRGSRAVREHDRVTFWLIRWLLFRLMFASGVVKLTSRCPTWWGLTALTYHYETQCIPTPLAWFAHQLPVWWQKLSVVGAFVIEIPLSLLFFSPLRRLRLGAFYMQDPDFLLTLPVSVAVHDCMFVQYVLEKQVLLQVLIILSGNYNFFNLLTLTLCLSLLDDRHINFWLRKANKFEDENNDSKLLPWLCSLLELVVWALMIIGTIICFDLQVDSAKNAISSRTAFTYHQFNQFLKTVTFPIIWIGVLSLTWELVTSMFRCACVPGFLKRFSGMIQWTVFAASAVSMFAVSLVPFSFIEYDSHSRLWPGVRQVFGLVDRYQLVNSYGLFRRMTGVGGRPEVVIEGSKDGNTWTEIEFMYKPGNLSAAPPVVTPHQPRLDWQMWFAALGPQTQSPWFTSLMYRLLQGKREVIELIQTDVSKYPFHEEPPAYLRAHRYRYWFTEPKAVGSYPERWWRRVYDEEFYPRVHLGNTFLDGMLSQFGLKDKSAPRRVSNATVAQAMRWMRTQVRGFPAHMLIWTLIACSATFCLLPGLRSKNKHAEQTAFTHQMGAKLSDHTEGVDEGLSDLKEEEHEQQAKEEEEDERNTEDEEEEEEEGNEKGVISENDDDEEMIKKHEILDESF